MNRPATGRARAAALLLVSSGSALAACGWIVGANDYAVGDAGSDATIDSAGSPLPDDDGAADVGAVDSRDAPSDGAREARGVAIPDAGVTDGDADAGARGEGVTDAGAEAEAEGAGRDAGDGSAPVCGQGLPTGLAAYQELVKTCVLAESCDGYFFPQSISECITQDYLHSTTAFTCLQSIATCADFTACYGYANPTATDCPTAQAGGTCDVTNNRAINCVGVGAGAVTDCAVLGGTCAIDDAGAAIAGCVVVPSCSQLDGGTQCSGDAIYSCAGGRGFGIDCSAIHATCETVGGATSCYFDAPACTDAGYACAPDGTLTWCTSAAQSFTFRCPSAGLSCALDDAGTGHCVDPGCGVPTTCTESCGADGKTITVCVGGAPYTIDCTQYAGFTRCSQALNAARNVEYARCIP
jgi:hypothetical protein